MTRGTKGALMAAVGLILGTAPGVGAQSVELGIRGGFTATTVAWKPSPLGTELDHLRRRKSGIGGVFVGVRPLSRLSVRVEALYDRKGFIQDEGDGNMSRLEVDYLEVPILLGWALRTPSERVLPGLFAGPWLATEATCDVAIREGDTSASFDCDEIPNDPVLRKTLDWGMTVGIGVELRDLGPFTGSLDLRYSAGLRNIDGEAEVDNVHAHHRGVSGTVGLAVPVGS